MQEISEIVEAFANGMTTVDATRPVAINVRSKNPYKPGIGPHTERQTVRSVSETFSHTIQFELEVPYPDAPRSKCDIVIRAPEEWSIEIKMLRFMGDNGKPNDNILMHIPSPYPAHRSAVTDTDKLHGSELPGRKGIIIYGYDYEAWPMDPAIDAFETLVMRRLVLSKRSEARTGALIHPVHTQGRVFGWEILGAA